MSEIRNKKLIPTICGIGFIGIGEHKYSVNMKAYQSWVNMLMRCYDKKIHEKFPTYSDITVCEEWHNFQVFSEWFDNNHINGHHLDKDLLSDNKIYSPKTCIFIPEPLNLFLTNTKSTNASGEIGVGWDKEKSKYKTQIKIKGKSKHLGYFSDKMEASRVYQTARAEQAEIWKQRMAGVLPPHAIERIK